MSLEALEAALLAPLALLALALLALALALDEPDALEALFELLPEEQPNRANAATMHATATKAKYFFICTVPLLGFLSLRDFAHAHTIPQNGAPATKNWILTPMLGEVPKGQRQPKRPR